MTTIHNAKAKPEKMVTVVLREPENIIVPCEHDDDELTSPNYRPEFWSGIPHGLVTESELEASGDDAK